VFSGLEPTKKIDNEGKRSMGLKQLFPLLVAVSLSSVPMSSYSSESTTVGRPGVEPAQQEEQAFTAEQVDKQLNYLMAKSYESGQEEIKLSGAMRPYAVGLLPDGQVKILHLKKEQPVPVDVAVRVLGSAMKSWMEQGLAVATVVYYTAQGANKNKQNERLFLIELKHANGNALTRMVPYTVEANGVVGFGKVIEKEAAEK